MPRAVRLRIAIEFERVPSSVLRLNENACLGLDPHTALNGKMTQRFPYGFVSLHRETVAS